MSYDRYDAPAFIPNYMWMDVFFLSHVKNNLTSHQCVTSTLRLIPMDVVTILSVEKHHLLSVYRTVTIQSSM